MRIAYISPYQGPALLKQRPIVRNLSLAGNVKIALIARLLRASGHDVEILSQGEVIERQPRFFPAVDERVADGAIAAFYASALPVKYVNAVWPSLRLLGLFRARHRARPFDLVLLYNLQRPQVACAIDAIRHLRLPVVLEYEDDALVDVCGARTPGAIAAGSRRLVRWVLASASGCTGVSPHLLSQVSHSTPTLLLRGVVSDAIVELTTRESAGRKNIVVYSGTHSTTKGLEQLVTAWRRISVPGWELHIAGEGELTTSLKRLAEGRADIVFHGLVDVDANARLLTGAAIAINPHDVSHTPGNVFAFKIIECLAAGTHVITTPMGALEPELEAGITYMPANDPGMIADTLTRVIAGRHYSATAVDAAQARYGPAAISASLNGLMREAMASHVARGRAIAAPATFGTRPSAH